MSEGKDKETGGSKRLEGVLTLDLVAIEEGATVRLVGGETAEVVDNPRDGMWILLRYTEVPDDPARAGRLAPRDAAGPGPAPAVGARSRGRVEISRTTSRAPEAPARPPARQGRAPRPEDARPRRAAARERKAEHPDWSLLKIGETCQRRWDLLGDEAKAPYVELAQTDAKRYKAEAAAYLAKM